MIRLNVGCGRTILPGWVNIDRDRRDGADIAADLNNCGPPFEEHPTPRPSDAPQPLPFADNSVDEFLLSHVIEHIPNALALMQELHRIAKPGAYMCIRVPHGASDDAWEDPTHVRAYFPGSFGYFSQPYYWKADYGYRGDWLTTEVALMCAGTGLTLTRANTERNVVREIVATLHAIKPIREPKRELQVAPSLVIRSYV